MDWNSLILRSKTQPFRLDSIFSQNFSEESSSTRDGLKIALPWGHGTPTSQTGPCRLTNPPARLFFGSFQASQTICLDYHGKTASNQGGMNQENIAISCYIMGIWYSIYICRNPKYGDMVHFPNGGYLSSWYYRRLFGQFPNNQRPSGKATVCCGSHGPEKEMIHPLLSWWFPVRNYNKLPEAISLYFPISK